jgi:hypothetical protein
LRRLDFRFGLRQAHLKRTRSRENRPLVETPFQWTGFVNVDQDDQSLAAGMSRKPGPPGLPTLTRDLKREVYPNRPLAANHENKGG